MTKIILTIFTVCAINAIAPQSNAIISIAHAAVDPIPGIDIIVERDPEDEPITAGNCWRKGLFLVQGNQGKWYCVNKKWAQKKYPTKKTYSLHDAKQMRSSNGYKGGVKFKAGADLAGKVN